MLVPVASELPLPRVGRGGRGGRAGPGAVPDPGASDPVTKGTGVGSVVVAKFGVGPPTRLVTCGVAGRPVGSDVGVEVVVVAVGAVLGRPVGADVGVVVVGVAVGAVVKAAVWIAVGSAVGAAVGAVVGIPVAGPRAKQIQCG